VLQTPTEPSGLKVLSEEKDEKSKKCFLMKIKYIMKKFMYIIISMIISTNAFANKIEKNAWVNNIKNAMPTYICQSNTVFRQCFTVTTDECIDVASSATTVCLKNIDKKIPSKLKMPEEGEKFGGDVGECVGITYGSVLSNKIIKTDKCNKLIYGK
jgi:hypothetical protein